MPAHRSISLLLATLYFGLLGAPNPGTAQGQTQPNPGANAAKPADFVVETPLLYVPPGLAESVHQVPLRYTGTPGQVPPIVTDGQAGGSGVQVKFQVGDVHTFDTEAGWLMTVTVTNARELVASQKRTMMIKYDGRLFRKSYTIEPGETAAIEMSLAPPLKAVPWTETAPMVPLQVTFGRNTVRNLRLVTGGVQDATSGKVMGGSYHICPSDNAGTCAAAIPELRGPGTTQLWLKPRGDKPSPGAYAGGFVLAADGTTAPAFSLVFNVTSIWAKIGGGALIAVGTLLGMLLTYGLKGRANILQAARPAALVLDRVEETKAEIARLKAPFGENVKWTELDGALRGVSSQLNAKALASYGVRRSWTGVLASLVSTPRTAELSAHVAIQAAVAAKLDVLARRGIGVVLATEPNPPAVSAPTASALATLDRLAANPTIVDATAMQTAIDAVIADLNKAATTAIRTGTPLFWTADRIDIEAARLSGAWLAVAALLTILAGLLVLILRRPDFGRAEDYIVCLLWGFGLSTGAGALPNLSAETIRTQIGLPKPT
jgi:hypothetical protein